MIEYTRTPFFKMFSTGASTDMAVNGTTAVLFKATCDAGAVVIERVNFKLVDGALQYGKFGGLTALTKGLEITWRNEAGDAILDFTDGENIKANEDFALLAGVDSFFEPAAGDDFLPVRWTIGRSGQPLLLRQGEYLQIKVQDDLQNLSAFKAMAQGYYPG